MIWLALIAGIIAGQFFPDQFREWVRALAGKARGLVLGAAPASVSEIRASAHNADLSQSDHSAEVRPSPPNKPIVFGRALSNLAGFLWRWKWAILVLCFFILAVGLMRGCAGPLDFGKSRGQIALERELAEQEVRTQEQLRKRDAAIAEIRSQTAVQLAQIRLESQRGRDAIAAATPEHEDPIDPNLVAAWRDALDRLCVARANGDRANSCGP